MNHWEARNRALKVSRLVTHIVELFDLLHMHPERDGIEMAHVLRIAFGDAEWTAAAVNCGSPGASVTTRLAVLAYFTGAQRTKESA